MKKRVLWNNILNQIIHYIMKIRKYIYILEKDSEKNAQVLSGDMHHSL